MRFDANSVDIPSAGTRVQVSNTTDKVAWIQFRARDANTGSIYVGIGDVSSSNGYELGAGGGRDAVLTLDFRPDSILFNVFYVDAATDGEDVDYSVILR